MRKSREKTMHLCSTDKIPPVHHGRHHCPGLFIFPRCAGASHLPNDDGAGGREEGKRGRGKGRKRRRAVVETRKARRGLQPPSSATTGSQPSSATTGSRPPPQLELGFEKWGMPESRCWVCGFHISDLFFERKNYPKGLSAK